jgi:hypothetical protein
MTLFQLHNVFEPGEIVRLRVDVCKVGTFTLLAVSKFQTV